MMRMMLAAVAAVAMTAAASADPMATRIGNTTSLTDKDGKVTKVCYKAGGTLDAVGPDGVKGTGKWAVKDGKLCVTPDMGPNAGKESCNPLADHKVGDEWEVPAPDGSKWKAKLTAGASC